MALTNVMWIISVQKVELLKLVEKGPPTPSKMPFNPGFMSGPIHHEYDHKCLAVAWTYILHINDAWFGPLNIIIQVHRSTFSNPLSPRTRYGHPNSLMVTRNSLRTVSAVLLADVLIPVIWKHYQLPCYHDSCSYIHIPLCHIHQ